MTMNIKLDRPLAVIDIESTGLDTHNDRIIEISVLKLMPSGQNEHQTRRCRPDFSIPPEATAVHGIADEDVSKEMPFGSIAADLLQFMDGCDLCGFNILGFDLRLLLAEFRRVGLDFPLKGRRIIDVKTIYHRREPRDLKAAYKFYCGKDHTGAHGAAKDVLATAEILDSQVIHYADLPAAIGELHDQLQDPLAVDLGGMFSRNSDDVIVFAKGKYQGWTLEDVAREKPDYLRWMLRAEFFPDTKDLVADALNRVKRIPSIPTA